MEFPLVMVMTVVPVAAVADSGSEGEDGGVRRTGLAIYGGRVEDLAVDADGTLYAAVNSPNAAPAAVALAPAAVSSAPATGRRLKGTPGQPNGLVVGPGSVRLSWAQSKPRAKGFNVRMATSPEGPWLAVTGCADIVSGTQCIATGLANNTPYYFQVQGVRGKRAGRYSPTSDPVTLTCASGSSCVVGDTGPGGGTVFYAAATPFDAAGDTYLEFADAGDWVDWTSSQALPSGGFVDPGLQWCGGSPPTNDTALGTGAANTARLAACDGEQAAHAAQAYRGGGKADWFLPSADEANLECQFAAGVASPAVDTVCAGSTSLRAGFAPDLYWTSSSMNLTGMLTDLAAEGGTPVPCLTGQPALTAAVCASILSNLAPALAQNFGPTLNNAGSHSAATACSGAVAPVFVVPAALGLPADSGHRDHRDRAIVIARIGDRDRSEATRGGR